MAELRHDFRAYYGVSYDEVAADEAVELARMLPAGSRFKAAAHPALAWSDERRMLADVGNLLYVCAARLSGDRGELSLPFEPPETAAMRAEARKRARAVRERIESTEWEAV